MARVLVFGVNDTAQLAHYYLREDSPHEVVAFCVDREWMPATETFDGLPVVAFDDVAAHYPPAEFAFLAPLTAADMNRARARVHGRIRERGYACISYVSSHATVLTDCIGENCFILEDNTIQPFVRIGDNVVLWSGNHIGHHSRIRAHAFITSHVVVSGHCDIGEYAFLGVNSTLRDGIHLAEGTFVAMSAAITRDTQSWQAYAGVPARALRRSSTSMHIYHALD